MKRTGIHEVFRKIVTLGLLSLTVLTPTIGEAASVVSKPSEERLLTDIVQLDAGNRSAYAVKSDGSAWAWGGGYGSIGNGAKTPAYTPVRMHIEDALKISGGDRHSLILKKNGSVWAVGGNEHGQLGNGQQTASIFVEPVQVRDLSDVIIVSAGSDHSLALKSDGTVWGWGGNQYGQVGDGASTNSLVPVQVKNLPKVVSVSAGMYTSAALGNGGEVWVWGLAAYGGDKSDVVRNPTRLKGDGEFKAIAVDQFYGTALRGDGTVWIWKNQAWVMPNLPTLEPFQIENLKDIVSISTNAAVRADGTVWQWNLNERGEPQVTQVLGISSAVSITNGGRNQYALLRDGHVLSWGTNEFGQTGLGVLDFEIKLPQFVKKSIGITINGEEVEMATPPLLLIDSVYVPIRGIFEQMGMKLEWDVKTRSVIAKNGTSTFTLNSVSGLATINGQTLSSAKKIVFVNGSVFVPLRLISETFGSQVTWDAAAYMVRIDK
ncbi:stalk domain-containing protein [Paenibacillus wynnii]|uniref:RCC1 domain-containing protein n=1 Tax=Paenibacillus wynnii TaxID=268407 RepID=UPI00068D20A2|nr:stalk domain-containing protein [Paenibacillus wynnii]